MPASLLEAMFADLLYQATPRSGPAAAHRERRPTIAGLPVNVSGGRQNGGGAFSVDGGGAYSAMKIDRRASEACLKQLHHGLPPQHQQMLLMQSPPAQSSKDIAALTAVKAAVAHGGAAAAAQSAVATASRYKTEMCRPFEETGHCRYGFKCQFAHGVHELRNLNRHPKYKTELCRTFHSTGFCSYGQRCNFIHNDDERLPASAAAPQPAPDAGRRPRALSIAAMGSAGDSPASSVSGDSPSSSPGFLTDDVFGGRAAAAVHFFPSSPAPPVSPIGGRRCYGHHRHHHHHHNAAAAACGGSALYGGPESSLPDSGFTSDDLTSPPSPVPSDDYPTASVDRCYCDRSPAAFDLCGLHHSLFQQLTIGGGELN